jgi:hypothetical protein
LDGKGTLLDITDATTSAGERTLRLPTKLQPLLAGLAKGKKPDERLFGDVDRHWLRRVVKQCCKAAGVRVVGHLTAFVAPTPRSRGRWASRVKAANARLKEMVADLDLGGTAVGSTDPSAIRENLQTRIGLLVSHASKRWNKCGSELRSNFCADASQGHVVEC